MKLNTLATTLLAAFVVVSLGACGKKKNGAAAAAAATPGSACIFNPQTQQYQNAQGQVCNPNATQTTCPANGIYTNQYGQQVACTPGQVINTGGYNYPGQYGGGTGNQNQSGCDQYYYQYGVQYVPVVLSGQLQCVRIDLVAQYAPSNSGYSNNYDYYYAYPPYEYQQGTYCGSQVSVNFGGFSGSMCF